MPELKHYLQGELQAATKREQALSEQLHQRLEQVQATLTQVIEQTGNGLSATVGELEDRLERQLPPRGGDRL